MWKVTVVDDSTDELLQEWEQPIEPDSGKLDAYIDIAFPNRELRITVVESDEEDGDN